MNWTAEMQQRLCAAIRGGGRQGDAVAEETHLLRLLDVAAGERSPDEWERDDVFALLRAVAKDRRLWDAMAQVRQEAVLEEAEDAAAEERAAELEYELEYEDERGGRW